MIILVIIRFRSTKAKKSNENKKKYSKSSMSLKKVSRAKFKFSKLIRIILTRIWRTRKLLYVTYIKWVLCDFNDQPKIVGSRAEKTNSTKLSLFNMIFRIIALLLKSLDLLCKNVKWVLPRRWLVLFHESLQYAVQIILHWNMRGKAFIYQISSLLFFYW